MHLMCMCVYNFFLFRTCASPRHMHICLWHRILCWFGWVRVWVCGVCQMIEYTVQSARNTKKKGWFENLKWTRRRRCGFFVFAIQPNAMSMRILINIIDLMSMRWSCWPNRFKIDSIESIALFRLQYWMMHEKLHLSTDSAHNRIDD